jgi:hypothetical protein
MPAAVGHTAAGWGRVGLLLLLLLLRLLVNSLNNLLHRSGKDTEQAERGDG